MLNLLNKDDKSVFFYILQTNLIVLIHISQYKEFPKRDSNRTTLS